MAFRFVTRGVKSACAGLAALALAFAPIEAEAYFVPRHQAPWPGLTNSSSYTPACNRFTFHTTASAETTDPSFLGNTHCVSPNYAISNLRFVVSNFYVQTGGQSSPEACPGNAETVDFMTVDVGGTFYPVTFGGALSVAVDNCRSIISDPLVNSSGAVVSLAANTAYYVRISRTIASGGKIVNGATANVDPTITTTYAGLTDDQFTPYPTPQTAYRLSLTMPSGGGSGGNLSNTPTLAVAQGWNGTAVYCIVGDSIGWGEHDYNFLSPYTSGSGAIQRALWDAASGVRNFLDLTVPGTYPETQSSIGAGQYQLRMQALRSIGNAPCNQIILEMGQNSPTIAGTSLAAFEAVEKNWWQFLQDYFAPANIFQVNFPAHAGSLNNTEWTTLADQTTDYPSGVRWQAGAYIAANSGLPLGVKGIDLTPYFTTSSGFTSQAGLWPITGWSGTIATAVSSGKAVVVAGSVAPALATALVMNVGTSNVEVHNIVKITGSSSPWTLNLDGNISHSYAVGAAVETALTAEGTHPYYPLYQAAANALIALKTSGVLP